MSNGFILACGTLILINYVFSFIWKIYVFTSYGFIWCRFQYFYIRIKLQNKQKINTMFQTDENMRRKGRSKNLKPLSICSKSSHAAAAKSLQLCPTLCDPIDGSPPGSAVPGILQARTLEWVAISFSNAWKWKVKVKLLSRVWLFTTPWTKAYRAPLSMGLSRQEYWSGVPLSSPKVFILIASLRRVSQVVLVVKNSPANARDIRDAGLIYPGLGRSPEGRHGNLLKYSFLENPLNRRAWWATVHGVTKSWTWLSDWALTRGGWLQIQNMLLLYSEWFPLTVGRPRREDLWCDLWDDTCLAPAPSLPSPKEAYQVAGLKHLNAQSDNLVSEFSWTRLVCLLTKSCLTLWPHGSSRLLCPLDSPGKNTGVSCHFLVQGIFATQGLLPRLQLCPGSLPLATCRPLQDTRAYSGHQHGLGPALARNSTAVYETHRPTLQIPCPLYPVFFFFFP